MDKMYQRSKIQDERLYYESRKHDGSLPLIGVNTFLPERHVPDGAGSDRQARGIRRSGVARKRPLSFPRRATPANKAVATAMRVFRSRACAWRRHDKQIEYGGS